MDVPTSEVSYTPAMPRSEDHEVQKDMWWHLGGEDIKYMLILLLDTEQVEVLRKVEQ